MRRTLMCLLALTTATSVITASAQNPPARPSAPAPGKPPANPSAKPPAKPSAKPAARPAAGGDERCIFQIDNVDRQGSVIETPRGTNYFAGGNVRLRCRGTQTSMQSDSVAAYGGTVVQFIGNVKYRDSTLSMDADFGTYFKAGEKWEARGRVNTRNLRTGSTIVGPALDYFRELRGVRDTFEMFSTGRPRVAYASLDSAGSASDPYVIVGDRIRARGNDRLWAGGKVTVDRSDFTARGDSLRLDTGTGSDGTLVGGQPQMKGLGRDTFSLSGRRIDLKLDNRQLTYVIAKGNGRAVSRDWYLVGDTIALDLNDRKLERTLAWGDSTRPSATSTAYALKADSLALDTPGQRLRQVRGFGRAWLGGQVDSAAKDRDWMRGDTIIADFAPRDSAGTTRQLLSRIQARKGAQSYHLDPDRRFPTRPGVNYARGDAITVTMRRDGANGVDRVDVRGQVDGVQ
ncbi:MAG: hypothetical protein H0W67_07775, partial [Gemmatimonadales bacterium]|nr:hypothetical protein [Gemmatimonadales bacterium]